MRHSGRPVLSVALALVFGYSLTIAPMLRSGSRTGRGDPNRPSGLMDPAGWAVGVREMAMNHPPSRAGALPFACCCVAAGDHWISACSPFGRAARLSVEGL
jgi:hypothetical protein